MENTGGSSKKRQKKGFFAKAIERWRSLSGEMKTQSKSNPSSPRPGFWNRSKSTSYASLNGSTKKEEKKNVFTKPLPRSRSLSSWPSDTTTQSKFNPTSPMPGFFRRSISTRQESNYQVAPAGCFKVCVGPKEERFVLKTGCLNHPLFQALLKQAENEFGFGSNGPLMLPCDVEIFQEVILEMEQQSSPNYSSSCNFSKSPYRYGLMSPSPLVVAARI